ncbi:MAG: methylated-DNA--[protein]-cysteine S-methyltransferase [Gemmatimonadales bacterium]
MPLPDLTYTIGQTSLGHTLVATDATGIVAVLLGDDAESLHHDLTTRFPDASTTRDDETNRSTLSAVLRAIEDPGQVSTLPLAPRGTAFQRRVWDALRTIPPGTTVSYTGLAGRIGSPRALRAVAHACGANPIAVLVPCHRVVRSDGALAGYRWGLDRKRQLLDLEQAVTRTVPLQP